MKTDDLLRVLVADGGTIEPPVATRLWRLLPLGLAATALLFLTTLGPRPDIAAAVQTVRFVLKPIEMALPAVLAAALMLRLARPTDQRTARLSAGLAAVAALLVAGVLAELVVVPSSEWGRRLVGERAVACLVSIPVLAAPLLAASLAVLRRGAPRRPGLAGAAAGLFAATAGAAFYALHCPDDSPLFVATWYSLAIVAVTAIGALAGRWLLRW
ncbi:DUF1109 family protein [Rhodoplanes serenus]|uniref:DUF1109 family protein n=1 Tax=Rhodoplanes serenus TaxID=200615 RepID=A0A9X4XP68_9BRAD|nr:NrsF family protein [Rhodoplanes serenus]MTW17129.1 DUF1109 family protein [Rhodoplanes serenus]